MVTWLLYFILSSTFSPKFTCFAVPFCPSIKSKKVREREMNSSELISLKNQYSLKLAAEIIKDTPFLDSIMDIHSNRLLHLALLRNDFLQEVLKDESLDSIIWAVVSCDLQVERDFFPHILHSCECKRIKICH